MQRMRLLLAVLAMAVIAAGCIREDSEGCNPGVDLTFEYTHNPTGIDMFGEEVEKVTVYVFGSDRLFVKELSSSVDAIVANGGKMRLDLPGGDYSLLVWGGSMDTYKVGRKTQNTVTAGLEKGSTSIENFRLWLTEDSSQSTSEYTAAAIPAELFYNKLDISAGLDRLITHKAEFIKNTSVIRLKFTTEDGTQPAPPIGTRADMPYEITLSGTNTMFDYLDNNTAEAPEYRYLPSSFGTVAENYNVEYKMPRLEWNYDTSVEIGIKYGNQEILAPDKLIQMIKKLKKPGGEFVYKNQTDLDREDEFEIGIKVTEIPGTGEILSVTITINGWNFKEIRPDF